MLSITYAVIISSLISFIIGWFARSWFGTDNKKQAKLTAELNDAQNKYQNYKTEVNDYFEKTAGLFNSLSVQYKSLYEHLLTGSRKLCEHDMSLPMLEHHAKQKDWQNILFNNNSQSTNKEPEHNWHPTYFEARDAKEEAEQTDKPVRDRESINGTTKKVTENKITEKQEPTLKVVANNKETCTAE